MRLPVIFACIFLAFACMVSAAQPVTVSATSSRASVLIGDQFDFVIKAEWDPNQAQVLAPLVGPKLGAFEVVKTSAADATASNPAFRAKTWTITLQGFDTGEQQIPAIALKYKLASSTAEQTLQSAPISIRVNSALDASKKPGEAFPLKPPSVIAPNPYYRNRNIALALGALIIACLIAYAIHRLRRRENIVAQVVDTRSPEQIAYEELDALVEARLIEHGELKQHYSRLSEILRAYLERRLAFAALEMTTAEITPQLHQRQLPSQSIDTIGQLLSDADMAKFAKWQAPRQRAEESIILARSIVRDISAFLAQQTESREGVA